MDPGWDQGYTDHNSVFATVYHPANLRVISLSPPASQSCVNQCVSDACGNRGFCWGDTVDKCKAQCQK